MSLLDRIRRAGTRRYARLRMSPLVWGPVLNRASRTVFDAHRRPLRPVEEAIAEGLARDGIAFSSLEELFPKTRLLAECRDTFERQRGKLHAQAGSHKDGFMEFIWGGGGTFPEIDLGHPCIRALLSDSVLQLAGQYLGSAPKLQGFSLQTTRLVSADAARTSSQRWHRDPDDRRMLKMFLYLSDVDDSGAGPFMYVKGSQEGGRWRAAFPQQFPAGSYPPDGAVETRIGECDRVSALGKAGTIVFADTSGLHRGGFSTEVERAMFAGGFVTTASTFPKNYRESRALRADALEPLVRFAVS